MQARLTVVAGRDVADEAEDFTLFFNGNGSVFALLDIEPSHLGAFEGAQRGQRRSRDIRLFSEAADGSECLLALIQDQNEGSLIDLLADTFGFHGRSPVTTLERAEAHPVCRSRPYLFEDLKIGRHWTVVAGASRILEATASKVNGFDTISICGENILVACHMLGIAGDKQDPEGGPMMPDKISELPSVQFRKPDVGIITSSRTFDR
jgi:hypothetical protein